MIRKVLRAGSGAGGSREALANSGRASVDEADVASPLRP